MTSLTLSSGHSRLTHHSAFSTFARIIRQKWADYRLMRSIESVPYDVMKDVGFPAAERANEM